VEKVVRILSNTNLVRSASAVNEDVKEINLSLLTRSIDRVIDEGSHFRSLSLIPAIPYTLPRLEKPETHGEVSIQAKYKN